ncbi:MAG: sulfatase [Cyclobacteriaceae bacterium]
MKRPKKIAISLCFALLFIPFAPQYALNLSQKPSSISSTSTSGEKPNIVFLISEDNSKHYMKLFDSNGVDTPHIQNMAQNGLVFNHAFSNSPVCSVARSTLITGAYTIRTGMHLHRKIALAPMPEGLEMFPAYLRKAGYFTTNNFKKDYNAVEGEDVWDLSANDATWKNREDPKQPFFHQETFTESHESRLHFERALMEEYSTKDDPNHVVLPPIYPDTPLFRFTMAYHRDKIRSIDEWVGQKIQELEKEGLLEDTFVFYFGDHGGVLPGSKGYVYETGLHVPLVVRIPENWKHLVNVEKGNRLNGFVRFIDFAPTALHLAGLAIPEQMDGKPFLGPKIELHELETRDETLGHADRFDEKYEMVRSLRKGKWKYIRSFQPYYPDGLQNNYRYKMLAFEEWRTYSKDQKLDEIQQSFFQAKPVERLYDVERDPYETKDLSQETGHRDVLEKMRGRLFEILLENNDLGFIPENVLVSEAIGNPVEYGKSNHDQIKKVMEINQLAILPFKEAADQLGETIENGNHLEKYWALSVASCFGKEALGLKEEIENLLDHPDHMVQLKAIEFLGLTQSMNPFPALEKLINKTQYPVEALIALNTLVYFKDHSDYPFILEDLAFTSVPLNEEVKRRLAYLKGEW